MACKCPLVLVNIVFVLEAKVMLVMALSPSPRQFNTMVEEVKPISMETEEGGAMRWEVISRGMHGGHSTQTFDSVFICSG